MGLPWQRTSPLDPRCFISLRHQFRMDSYEDTDEGLNAPVTIEDIPYEVLTGSLLPILDLKGKYMTYLVTNTRHPQSRNDMSVLP